MMKKIGFDAEKYLEEQSQAILTRIQHVDKLYLEFGGKLIGDYHAMRTLPGFDPDAKIKILHRLKDLAELVICIYAKDIEKSRMRGDYGITYANEVFYLLEKFRDWELKVNSVVITRYQGEPEADIFIQKLRAIGVKAYTHSYTEGYPFDIATIVSPRGYGKNAYIPTTEKLVVVTAPGANSGKLATCLSQLYHDQQRDTRSSYAKFETFPIWNLPLKHPVNVAYEAATADIGDVNMIDPFHLEVYGKSAVNYNRDIEQFPLLRRILKEIYGKESPYRSPTDMGVNCVGDCIIDDDVVREAANQEIIRRSFQLDCAYKKGLVSQEATQRGKMLMHEMQLTELDRPVVRAARARYEQFKDAPGYDEHAKIPDVTAIDLGDQMVTGKSSKTMTSLSACLLNSIKVLAGIQDSLHLLAPVILNQVKNLKEDVFLQKDELLDAKEILLALSISMATNPMAEVAFHQLVKLRGCQAHATGIPSQSDTEVCRGLGMDLTYDATYANPSAYLQ